MEKITTNQGKPGLLVEGYKFRMDKPNKTSHIWRCVKRSCTARCKTDLDDLMILDNQRLNHNHEPEEERKLQRQKLRQECKKRALEDVTERPKKIIVTEVTFIIETEIESFISILFETSSRYKVFLVNIIYFIFYICR